MFQKILVANRGEIAIRAFRAASELGIKTVAIYAHEDRYSLHRHRADESYQIGTAGHPLRAYLDIDAIIKIAKGAKVDAIYPGYGFLSENPALAEACRASEITFIGPTPDSLKLAGNKIKAVEVAKSTGLPTIRSVSEYIDIDDLLERAKMLRFPVFVKAAAGGGGRGLRLVDKEEDLKLAAETAAREAELSFGDPTIFVEEAVVAPKHIEVQVLADSEGEVVHLFERDCSIQRRHQKVVEIAPAPTLSNELRERICDDAVRFAKAVGYTNAGTVEFLVSKDGQHFFIEMNPRIQVEHTVTEEVTGIDIVRAQIEIAAGATLSDLNIAQEKVSLRGFAIQCRITTEDPSEDFRPDTGKITGYRTPGGSGVRLDESTYLGAEVLPYFDSMLVKLTCRGRDFREAIERALRALDEFRIRGVSTNIAFLTALLVDPDFQSGYFDTSFIASKPDLMKFRYRADRGTKLLSYLSEISVNRPNGSRPAKGADPITKLPSLDLSTPPPSGSRQRLAEVGPEKFAQQLRAQVPIAVTDTTLRDAHQSLLATRLRTIDMVRVVPYISRLTPNLLSLEAWGGATYDVALRFLHEDPWERLEQLSQAAPNICLQMLLRGQNTVGYSPSPKEVGDVFIREAARSGVDIFRIFDSLNDVVSLRPSIETVLEENKLAEGAICYTSDMLSPTERLYTLDYYLGLAEKLVTYGSHVICVKDMAGLLKAPAAKVLIEALRRNFDLPVHLHTHDTAGGQLATYLAAIEAGVDAIDGASATMAGSTSQPSLSAIVAATQGTERESGIDLDALLSLEPYFGAVRAMYSHFEAGLSSPTGRVYLHEIPGGQLSNLRQQAISLGLGERFEEIEEMYAAVNKVLGNIVKVTPSSKVVGDLALHLVAGSVDPKDFEDNPGSYDIPDSVIGFLRGELGTPPGGWPEPFRTKALKGRGGHKVTAPVLTEVQKTALHGPDVRLALSQTIFPGPTREYLEYYSRYGSLSLLPSDAFFFGLEPGEEVAVSLEPGLDLYLAIDAIGAADAKGYRDVYTRLNGQPRVISVKDDSVSVKVKSNQKADPSDPSQVAAPFTGVVTIDVSPGDSVKAGQTIATIEAMKMEAAITSPLSGTVEKVVLASPVRVEGGDLLLVIS
ncbi:pyruvate carboxylase [Ferrithrix thermotolerans DSM 19514]|uniref:Pyruvate carboxylase n=1 Tax=Ferrithrix thermotolerans DSM 19514 TaxID=1121881 RepID=A0A1M4WQE9_9ACTN|nr:pyruvate carboxylase [Ferrithrix thermotolerans]SHE83455.1 pyruvate carboxylase [Ferrithrix thermotolerans DSM 19514]